ncbi:MAG: hypothetical protein AB1626_03360 [Candidatus Micrarchaeota archaeon]
MRYATILVVLFITSFAFAIDIQVSGQRVIGPIYADNEFFWVSYWNQAGERTINVENGVPDLNSVNRSGSFSLIPKEGMNVVFAANPRVMAPPVGGGKWMSFNCIDLHANNLPNGGLNISLEYNPLCGRCGENYRLALSFSAVGAGQTETPFEFFMPILVPCEAQALIITDSRKFDPQQTFDFPEFRNLQAVSFKQALGRYFEKLAGQAISARFFDFGDQEALAAFSIEAPSAADEGTAESSFRYVAAVRKLRAKAEASQLVIAGGIKVIPMPVLADPYREGGLFGILTKHGYFASDDLYVMQSDHSIPFYAVSRFPTPVDTDSMELAVFSMVIAAASAEPYFALSHQAIFGESALLGDKCGAIDRGRRCYQRDNVFETYDRLFSGAADKSSCDSDSLRCLPIPRACFSGTYMGFGSHDETPFTEQDIADNCRPEGLESTLANSQFLYLVAHGRPNLMAGAKVADSGDNKIFYTVVSADYLITNFVDNWEVLSNLPVVVTSTCRAGAISNETPEIVSFGYSDSLALSFLRDGARYFLGRTSKMYFPDKGVVEMAGAFLDGVDYLGYLLLDFKQRMARVNSERVAAAEAELDDLLAQVEQEQAETDLRRTALGVVEDCPRYPIYEEEIQDCLWNAETAFVAAAAHFGIASEPHDGSQYLQQQTLAYLDSLQNKLFKLTRLKQFISSDFEEWPYSYSPSLPNAWVHPTRFPSALAWASGEKTYGSETSMAMQLYGDPFQEVSPS